MAVRDKFKQPPLRPKRTLGPNGYVCHYVSGSFTFKISAGVLGFEIQAKSGTNTTLATNLSTFAISYHGRLGASDVRLETLHQCIYTAYKSCSNN